jgi:7-cyano-7-deazaguanine synthase in queuosine biosynthesis
MRRVLILWTGGVESTSLLLWALCEPGLHVHAHHVRLDNPERRECAESTAIAALIWRLRKVRPFEFSSSSLSVCDGEALGWDAELVYPIGRVAARHHKCEQVLRGWCAEDEWLRAEGHPLTPWPGKVRRRFEQIAEDALGFDAPMLAPWLPLYAEPKAWHWERLGPLAELTWSCRRPVDGHTPCGKCHACIERFAANLGTSANPHIAERMNNA